MERCDPSSEQCSFHHRGRSEGSLGLVTETVDRTTTDHILDLAATLPVVISDTDAINLYGLDIIP